MAKIVFHSLATPFRDRSDWQMISHFPHAEFIQYQCFLPVADAQSQHIYILHFPFWTLRHLRTRSFAAGKIMNVPLLRDRGCQHVNIPQPRSCPETFYQQHNDNNQNIVPFTASGSMWVKQNGRLYPCHSTQKVFWSSSNPIPSFPDRAGEAISLHNPTWQHRTVPCALGQNLADTRVSPVHS